MIKIDDAKILRAAAHAADRIPECNYAGRVLHAVRVLEDELVAESNAEEFALRRLLAIQTCGRSNLYTDDGELQDNRLYPIDFKRDSAKTIEARLQARAAQDTLTAATLAKSAGVKVLPILQAIETFTGHKVTVNQELAQDLIGTALAASQAVIQHLADVLDDAQLKHISKQIGAISSGEDDVRQG